MLNDELIIYDAATSLNKKIIPNDLIPIVPTYTAGSGLTLSNQDQFSFNGSIGSTNIREARWAGDASRT